MKRSLFSRFFFSKKLTSEELREKFNLADNCSFEESYTEKSTLRRIFDAIFLDIKIHFLPKYNLNELIDEYGHRLTLKPGVYIVSKPILNHDYKIIGSGNTTIIHFLTKKTLFNGSDGQTAVLDNCTTIFGRYYIGALTV